MHRIQDSGSTVLGLRFTDGVVAANWLSSGQPLAKDVGVCPKTKVSTSAPPNYAPRMGYTGRSWAFRMALIVDLRAV